MLPARVFTRPTTARRWRRASWVSTVVLTSALLVQGAPAIGATTTPGTTAAPSNPATMPTPSPGSDAVPHAGVTPGTVRPFTTAQGVPGGYASSGVDVSSHNAPISWPTVAASGSTFAYVKATEGDYYTNPFYASDVANARANGVIAGPYVWPRPDYGNPVDQANFLLAAASYSPSPQSLPPMIDMEWGTAVGSTACYGLTPAQLTGWLHQFVGTLQQVTGRDPVIYTNTNWWNPCTGNDTSFGNLPLDIASWGYQPAALPAGWDYETFWQYTDNATVSGAGIVDGDVFNGTPSGLATFAAAGNRAPIGSLDSVTAMTGSGTVTLRGWALDPDATAPVIADVYIDGVGAARLTANTSRPDVGAAYPREGDLHGYAATLPVGSGTHQVCAYGIDSVGGPNALLGCQSTNHPPLGSLDAVSAGAGTLTVHGWTLDPDTTAPINADVSIDGVAAARLTANQSRPDVGAAYPGEGDLHGFSATLPAAAGPHQVCVSGIDSAGGPNTLLRCSPALNTPLGGVKGV
jgi:GH25 family lysozyme M1 (1,4-beta-N-acetylmuramidase)